MAKLTHAERVSSITQFLKECGCRKVTASQVAAATGVSLAACKILLAAAFSNAGVVSRCRYGRSEGWQILNATEQAARLEQIAERKACAAAVVLLSDLGVEAVTHRGCVELSAADAKLFADLLTTYQQGQLHSGQRYL